MSVVSNIILSVGVTDTYSVSTTIKQWLADRDRSPLQRIDGAWCDHKSMELPVFIGAYNYFPVPDFIDLISMQIDWNTPLSVVLVTQTEDSYPRTFEFNINNGFSCPQDCENRIDENKTRQKCEYCGRAYWVAWLWNNKPTVLRFGGL